MPDVEKASPEHGVLSQSSCFSCKGINRTEWRDLSHDEIDALNAAKVTRVYRSGERVFEQGEACRGLYCVGWGMLCTRKRGPTGADVPMRMRYPGDTMGVRAFFDGVPHAASVEALQTARVCFVDSTTVWGLFADNARLCVAFISRLANDLSTAEDRLLRQKNTGARSRIAQFWLDLFGLHGVVDREGIVYIRLPFSHDDMAAALGLNAGVLDQTLHTFEEEDIATVTGRRVRVKDLDRLRHVASARSDA